MSERIAIVGLGYVGLPLALAFARAFPGTVGFDIDRQRIEELAAGVDRTGETEASALQSSRLELSADPARLKGCTFFIITVPTPIDRNRQPDLNPVRSACEFIGPALRPGGLVVLESTVYPGVTEEFCRPLLERLSGLRPGLDFTLGYSPERINPGDREHTIERVIKVVAGEDGPTLERVAAAYEAIVPAGVHRASSIKVAEAAKVIENTQRDLNIALMNELAIIFERLGIRTEDVLKAARTKWNFLNFTPGLVGGHCIGVDPYYLTAKAQALGYHPEVILAGRRINDGMGAYVAKRVVKLLAAKGAPIKGARVGILGLTFKENVPDLRNSRVPTIIAEFDEYGVESLVDDPLVDAATARRVYGLELVERAAMRDLDALLLAVPHAAYRALPIETLTAPLKPGGIFFDLKSVLDPAMLPAHIHAHAL